MHFTVLKICLKTCGTGHTRLRVHFLPAEGQHPDYTTPHCKTVWSRLQQNLVFHLVSKKQPYQNGRNFLSQHFGAQTKFQFAVEQANFLQNYRNTACWIPFAICDMEQTWPLTNLKITFKNQLEQENQVPHQVSRPQELRGCSFPPQNNPWRIEPKRKQPATQTSWVRVSQQALTCWWTLNRCPLKSPGQPAISVWGIQRPNVP